MSRLRLPRWSGHVSAIAGETAKFGYLPILMCEIESCVVASAMIGHCLWVTND